MEQVLSSIDLNILGNLIVWTAGVVGGIAILHQKVIIPTLTHTITDIVEKVVHKHLVDIKHELTTNRGSSLKDAVIRIEGVLDGMSRELVRVESEIAENERSRE